MRNPKIVQVRIDNFQQRDPTSNAHPYVWVAFFKADGATLSVTAAGDVSGDCVVVSSPGSHGDLGNPSVTSAQVPLHMADGFDADGNPIGFYTDQTTIVTWTVPSDIGAWKSTIRPIRVAPPLQPLIGVDKAGVFGVVTVVFQEGGHLPNHAAEAGHRVFKSAVEKAINGLLRTLGPSHPELSNADINGAVGGISQQVHDAIVNDLDIWEKLWALTGADFEIGHWIWRWDQDAVPDSNGMIFFSTDDNKDPWWANGLAVTGTLTIADAPAPSVRIIPVYAKDPCQQFQIAGRAAKFAAVTLGPAAVTTTSKWAVGAPAAIIGSDSGSTCNVMMPDPPVEIIVSLAVTIDDGLSTYQPGVPPFKVTPLTVEEANATESFCEWWRKMSTELGHVRGIVVGPGDPAAKVIITPEKGEALRAVMERVLTNTLHAVKAINTGSQISADRGVLTEIKSKA